MVETNSSKESGNSFSFKIIMVGEAGVGKTCIVNRLVKNSFSNVEANVGANFSSKTISVQPSSFLKPERVKL